MTIPPWQAMPLTARAHAVLAHAEEDVAGGGLAREGSASPPGNSVLVDSDRSAAPPTIVGTQSANAAIALLARARGCAILACPRRSAAQSLGDARQRLALPGAVPLRGSSASMAARQALKRASTRPAARRRARRREVLAHASSGSKNGSSGSQPSFSFVSADVRPRPAPCRGPRTCPACGDVADDRLDARSATGGASSRRGVDRASSSASRSLPSCDGEHVPAVGLEALGARPR